jgi:hypothetical protein
MVKWLLTAWMLAPGGCWILAGAFVQRWQRGSSHLHQRRLKARLEMNFQRLTANHAHFVVLNKPWLNQPAIHEFLGPIAESSVFSRE